MNYTTIIGHGPTTRRRYKQGRGGGRHYGGRRRRRCGRGPKMEKFKSFLRKSAELGKKHVLPHLREIGVNTLMDVMEGKNVGQSLKSNARQTSSNIVRNHQRRQRASRTMNY